MPLYSYKCGVCSHKQDELRTIAKRNDLVLCEKCGSVCNRNFDHCRTITRTKSRGYWSNTMGVHPEQVAEERQLHPNWTYHNNGRLWVENRQDQKRKVAELGMTNFDEI